MNEILTEHPYYDRKGRLIKRKEERHWDFSDGMGHAPTYLVKLSRDWQRRTGFPAVLGVPAKPPRIGFLRADGTYAYADHYSGG